MEAAADALLEEAIALGDAEDPDAGIALCDEVLDRYAAVTDPGVRATVVRALAWKAYMLVGAGRTEEAVDVDVQLVERFGGSTDSDVRSVVATALFNQACGLLRLGRHEERLVVCDRLLDRYPADSVAFAEEDVESTVAAAAVHKGHALRAIGRHDEALAAYDAVVWRWGERDGSELLKPVGWAIAAKGDLLSELGRVEQEIATYDDCLRRFGNSGDPELRAQCLNALLAKARVLRDLNRHAEAIESYDMVLARCGEAHDPDHEYVVNALYGKEASARGSRPRRRVSRGQRRTASPLRRDPRSPVAAGHLDRAARARLPARAGWPGRGRNRRLRRIIVRLEDESDPRLRSDSPAFEQKARALESIGHADRALTTYDELIVQFRMRPTRRSLRGLAARWVCPMKCVWSW